MQYKVIVGTTAKELEDNMQVYINQGWHPAGGLAIGVSSLVSAGVSSEIYKNTLVNAQEYGNNLIFCQAITKD